MLELSVVLLLDSLSVMNKFLNHRRRRRRFVLLLRLTHTKRRILGSSAMVNLSLDDYWLSLWANHVKILILKLLLMIQLCGFSFPNLVEGFVIPVVVLLLVDIDL